MKLEMLLRGNPGIGENSTVHNKSRDHDALFAGGKGCRINTSCMNPLTFRDAGIIFMSGMRNDTAFLNLFP